MSDHAQEDTSVAIPPRRKLIAVPGRRSGKFRLVDFLIVVFCISGAVYSFNLFRLDLFSAITLQNEENIGTIILKNNIVQRRLAHRVLWERLAVDSPVFLGDLIRVAEFSSATIYIEGTHINLNENTLIRIQRAPAEEEAVFHIALDEGSLSLAADEQGETIMLNLMGQQIQASPGTVLNAEVREETMVLAVSEGAVLLVSEYVTREVVSGTVIAVDAEGTERTDPAAVILNPPPNARFLNNTLHPLPINFFWSRLHLDPDEPLRLEIAEDRNFTRIIHAVGNLDDRAQAFLDTGIWHWRLSFDDIVLSTGRVTVTGAKGPELLSPIMNSVYRFQTDLPAVRFQWSEIEGASSYLFQASLTPNFISPEISANARAAFFIKLNMEPGTWYWRVMPVFPPIYDGIAAFSPVASFHIEQVPEPVTDEAGVIVEEVQEELLIVLPQPIEIRLLAPADGVTLTAPPGQTQQQTIFTWGSDGEEVLSRFVLSRNSDPLAGPPAVEISNPQGRTLSLPQLESGRWYWTVEAQAANGMISAAPARHFDVVAVPIGVNLLIPAQGVTLTAPPGLAALQQQTIFSWGSNGEELQSRFVLSRSSNPLAGTPAVQISNPQGRVVSLPQLESGRWYWTVEAQGANGLVTAAPARHFDVSTVPIGINLVAPAQGAALSAPPGQALPQTIFTWGSNGQEVQSRFILSRNSNPLVGTPAVQISNPQGRIVSLPQLEGGRWYWTVEAQGANGIVTAAPVRHFDVSTVPIGINLVTPAQGVTLPGLTALRQQTIFSWGSNGEEVQSRFVLSRNSNPLVGPPAVQVANPQGRTVSLDRLEPGLWFWTVEAQAANGLVTTAETRQFYVAAIPLLAAPLNRLPTAGHRIGIQQLRTQTHIVFNWSPVPGANAYIFALYEQTPAGRREIIRTQPETQTSWTLDDLRVLDPGTFIWQVEAVNRGLNNVIEQRGIIAENHFVLDVPLPGPVQVQEPGILYGR